MIVAREKRKQNISEYILYMWQIEDMIRALQFDMNQIEKVLISQYKADDIQHKEIVDWYSNLVLMMQKEQKQQSGHMQFLVNLVNDLDHFHKALLSQQVDAEYIRLYQDIAPDIELVRQKSGKKDNDIEVVLNTLYLILMLKMKQQDVSEGTQKAVWKLGNFMGHLSRLYRNFESGDLELIY
ncbi:DUF4924 family protein [Roseimarinus sediminis]|uniref:DUF4924 family protein n=1 Tax=Roseimarinus sediminis TaxID=1610899 RepID=UPI003D1F0B03